MDIVNDKIHVFLPVHSDRQPVFHHLKPLALPASKYPPI